MTTVNETSPQNIATRAFGLPRSFIFGFGLIGGLVLWAYWPTLVLLEAAWQREPDYSHGYLVAPFAVFFLWSRRDHRPESLSGPGWGGLLLLLLGLTLRGLSAAFYMEFLDGWSIPITVCGLVWLLCGRDWLLWSWSALAFLVFMVPLPFRAESLLSLPLQRVAAGVATWVVQCLGFPAIQEGNVILIGNVHLEVERACNGLRMMMGVAALTCGYLIVQPTEWWQKSLIIFGALPIAIATNCIRIVITAILFQWISGDRAQSLSHDIAGWSMIPLASLMLWGYVRYVEALVVELEPIVVPKRFSR